jgi:cytoskeleton protein RodZ
MSSIGETLRRERLRQNLDLGQISRELKISQRFLEAIEAERFDRLPAGVFAKSFVRQYAGLLGLDPEELVAELQKSIEPAALTTRASSLDLAPLDNIQVPRVEHWEAVSDRGRFEWASPLPALALLVVVLLVCSGVYTFWQHSRQQTITAQTPFEAVPPPPPAVQPEQQAQTPPPPAAAPPAASEPAPNPAATPAQTAQTPPTTPPAQVHSADRGPTTVRVQVTATEAVWVLARADGKYLFSGTMEPNETRTVEAAERLTLRVGNAGGVTVALNGKAIGPVGPKGLVRELQFTSGGFQIVAAPKPSLPDDNPI